VGPVVAPAADPVVAPAVAVVDPAADRVAAAVGPAPKVSDPGARSGVVATSRTSVPRRCRP
jgi:hypothetical protein